MKVTPQITADLEEYPELATLLNAVIRPVVDLMGAHAITSLRRIRKTGVFDHPYDKEVVTSMDMPVVPESVRAVQYMVGKALLDYLEAIGISGLSLEMSQDEVQAIANLWAPRRAPQDKPLPPNNGDGLDPVPVGEQAESAGRTPDKTEPRPEEPDAGDVPSPWLPENPQSKPRPKPKPQPSPALKHADQGLPTPVKQDREPAGQDLEPAGPDGKEASNG